MRWVMDEVWLISGFGGLEPSSRGDAMVKGVWNSAVVICECCVCGCIDGGSIGCSVFCLKVGTTEGMVNAEC